MASPRPPARGSIGPLPPDRLLFRARLISPVDIAALARQSLAAGRTWTERDLGEETTGSDKDSGRRGAGGGGRVADETDLVASSSVGFSYLGISLLGRAGMHGIWRLSQLSEARSDWTRRTLPMSKRCWVTCPWCPRCVG